jgi:hypothetical protein
LTRGGLDASVGCQAAGLAWRTGRLSGVELPDEMSIEVAQTQSVQLPGLAQGGYRWRADVIEGDPDVVDVSLGFADHEPGRAAGAQFADEVLTVRGRRPGRVTLALSQRRSWEPPAAAVREHRLAVSVITTRSNSWPTTN